MDKLQLRLDEHQTQMIIDALDCRASDTLNPEVEYALTGLSNYIRHRKTRFFRPARTQSKAEERIESGYPTGDMWKDTIHPLG